MDRYRRIPRGGTLVTILGDLSWSFYAADRSVPVNAGTINIDEMNVPAITVSITAPLDPDIAALDPRQTPAPRGSLTGTYTDWASLPISAVTDYIADQGITTLAGLSTEWSGLELRDVSALFGAPLHSGAIDHEAGDAMDLHLHIREIEVDEGARTMSILLASDEALLTDWGVTDGLDFAAIGEYAENMNVQWARTYIDPILQHVLGIRTDVNAYTNTMLSTVYTDVINRTIDMSAWEMIRQPLDDADLKLRPGRDGRGFSLQAPTNELPDKPWFSLIRAEDVQSVRRRLSRNDDWYDSVSLSSGDDLATRIFKGGPTGVHSRTYRETFPDGTPLTSSQVRNINARNKNRGQFLDITMPIRLGVFTMDEFTYVPESGVAENTWRVQAVSYDIETCLQNIRAVQRY